VSTVKQHLRAAYKTLRVKNRTQAARAFRRGVSAGGG
jgi:DNA-binding NarL/FixJ family response regulator